LQICTQLRFKAGQTIAGRVQTSDGAPVEGAQVSAVPEAARGRRDRADIDGLTFGGALSGPDGTFEVRNLEAGKYQMAARKEGFAASMQLDEPVMASTGDSSVSLVLKSEGKIRGRVVDVDGKPVPGSKAPECREGRKSRQRPWALAPPLK